MWSVVLHLLLLLSLTMHSTGRLSIAILRIVTERIRSLVVRFAIILVLRLMVLLVVVRRELLLLLLLLMMLTTRSS